MKKTKDSIFRGIVLSFIVFVVALIAHPHLAVIVSGVSGGVFGFLFAVYGLSDEELQRLSKGKG